MCTYNYTYIVVTYSFIVNLKMEEIVMESGAEIMIAWRFRGGFLLSEGKVCSNNSVFALQFSWFLFLDLGCYFSRSFNPLVKIPFRFQQ